MTVYTTGEAAAILDVPEIVERRICRKLGIRGCVESVRMDEIRRVLREEGA